MRRFPTYFQQTKHGAYNGMIKHNLEKNLANACGSSLNFVEMLPYKTALQKFVESTGKPASEYFSLMAESKHISDTLFTPFPSVKKDPKHPMLQGYQANHTDFLI